ncbi:PIN domain-like protein [Mycena leptocephala]|nr:PIN domain-like protein [Mycena leptocephala]
MSPPPPWAISTLRACIDELELIEQKISLPNLAVGTGFIGNATGTRGFRVGIDASGWMYRASNRHGNTENPELVALFSRCSRLFGLPFLPLFVFDGPERPRVKRGKVISGNNHWLATSFQQMLDGFGFQWITARGEAEATLSEMTTRGVPVRVDAILTDDSDSFVFGASVVLRIRSEDNENYEASRYSAFDILQVLGLSRDDFILIALLAGGDYSDGLAQCGVTLAIGLARAGLGRQLIAGLSTIQSQEDSILFLRNWREALRLELQTNTSGHLLHRYKQLAANIPPTFPTSSLPSPRLGVLARFAEDHFGWGDSIGILTHFSDQLFAGLVIRELTCRALAADNLATLLDSSIIKGIVGERHHKSTGYLAELRLMLDLDPSLLTSALQAINGTRDPGQGADAAVAAWITTTLPKVRVWVPKSMVEHVYPDIVLDYVCAQNSKQSRKKKTKTTRQRKIDVKSPGSAGSSSSVTTANQESHATAVYDPPNKQPGSFQEKHQIHLPYLKGDTLQ